jgi:predicted RNA-binding protein
MAYWLFVVTSHKSGGEEFSGEDILQTRFKDHFWGLGERTPNRKRLKKGDEVVFYMGLPRKEFVASTALASDSFALSSNQIKQYAHNTELYASKYGVLLDYPSIWSNPVPAERLVPQLEFIENKEYWYSYFQGGVRELCSHDYRVIIQGRELSLTDRIRSEEDVESESEFALEAHLEEFIAQNWQRIDFGSKLTLFSVEDQSGRQFPAGPWSIDFLCTDQDTGELVVIELKRGKSSDATVGQILRYISWVEENLAEQSQGTRGIIIAREIDDALKYSIRGLSQVSVLTYRVDFELRSIGQ